MEDMATLNIKGFPEKLYRRLCRLAEREHRSVSQQVIHLVAAAVGESKSESILALRGLGKEVWAGVDPAAWVREERRSWE